MSNTGSHTSKCLRCGRTRRFHSAQAAAAAKPYGRICGALVRAAAIAEVVKGFKDAQVEKARELISDGGLVPLRAGIFRAANSAGDGSYLVARQACACPAGIHGRLCYHRAAVAIVLASKGA
jgi:hypothetical protein